MAEIGILAENDEIRAKITIILVIMLENIALYANKRQKDMVTSTKKYRRVQKNICLESQCDWNG